MPKLTRSSLISSIPTPFQSHSATRTGSRISAGTRTSRPSLVMPGSATPFQDESIISTDGDNTPAISTASSSALQPNLAQASRNLSKLVLEKNMRSNGFSSAPSATYTNIESAPSLAHTKHYCDITGLPAPYTDPKTRLRYHDKEVFGLIRTLGQGVAEQYLETRGAHTVLK
ncbi:hypothetical protein M430DRAFT_36489 [Amorphotheca resinae ATCC 22711]|uniref:Vps72/YL1 C-terminal domain-containing protein n=1 Tax=Amorphotheca resinae ATCC 22711 TaxID=857342 RepID=A0A2T3AUJ7_AMORE|nr:hypothetical protein M430DRAFT_36489 [Amorphotheca resinae ATCC 22711]PSS12331.1 hypothetical protein M430DRAFT_36489 [Amorphotheca resinae ATCC 22711]